jgi:hypothetical protein
MCYFTLHPNVFNQVLWLTADEVNNPKRVVKEFFEDYRLSELRQHLWHLMETAVTSSNSVYEEVSERSKLLHFYQQVEILLEAASLIANQK